MIRPLVKKACFVLLALIAVFTLKPVVFAETEQEKLETLNQKITEYESEVKRLNQESNTLNNQIAQYDAQINLTTLKITQTEDKISLLGGRINLLETSLSTLSNAFASRANQTYKLARLNNQPYLFAASSDQLSDAVSSFYYLRKIQEADRDLLIRLQNAQTTYISQKTDQENLQKELEGKKSVLGAQKSAKSKLLSVTRNDEKKYQSLLSQALAERDAIQAIIAGKGEETPVKDVNEGDRIASVINGPSPCSSGGHLHFEVVKSGTHQNPANYLISKGVIWDNAPDSNFNFSGSWQWPINDPVRLTQGYGMTYYAANLKYYGGAPHTGIDMVNENTDLTVKAVRPGKLFQGSISCGGGKLKYVRVEQSEEIDTYYLHVNY